MPNFGGVHIGVRAKNNLYILFVFNVYGSLGATKMDNYFKINNLSCLFVM
jgi:hypothetical protein